MCDEEGIKCFEIESVSERRRLPSSRAMEYLVKCEGYEKLHDTCITKKEAVTSGALKLLTDFDRTVTSGINLPDVHRISQINYARLTIRSDRSVNCGSGTNGSPGEEGTICGSETGGSVSRFRGVRDLKTRHK